MSYFNEKITVTLTANEMSAIRAALRYGAEQVQSSDIPVFESYESRDKDTGMITTDEYLYDANKADADLALELADTLGLIEAECTDWKVLNCESDGFTKDSVSVWSRHHKTDDFGTPLVREFIWSYTPKVDCVKATIRTSILEDCVMPCNTQIAVHREPYEELTDKSVVVYFTLDDLQNKIPIITGDDDIDEVILGALENFIKYYM